MTVLDHDNLEEFADPVDYDRADSSDTGTAFYAALARETGGPVLEIACGTGRVSLPIARLGFAVTGLDLVPGMLEQARRKSSGLPVRWVHADARTFDLGEQFRLIFLTGNAFQAFVTNTEQEAVLRCAHQHLHSGGRLAFEIRNPRWKTGQGQPELHQGAFFTLETRIEPVAGQVYVGRHGQEVRVSTTQTYDHAAQILHLTAHKTWQQGGQAQTLVTRTALRYTFPQELAALLSRSGLSLERQYGDWNLEPLSAASPSIIVVCRKAAGA